MSKDTWKDLCCSRSPKEAAIYVSSVLKDMAFIIREQDSYDDEFVKMVDNIMRSITNYRGYRVYKEIIPETEAYTSIELTSDAVWCDRCGELLGRKRYIRNAYAFCSAACAEKHLQDFGG